MKFLLSTLLIAAASVTVVAQDAPADSIKERNDSTGGFVFTDVKVIKTTPVRDQNRSGTCWCFSTNSFVEDEILRMSGKEVDLSEMFTVRHCYQDKADRYVRLYGDANFAAGGGAIDIPYVWEKYGAVPESAYPGILYGEDKHDHSELDAVLTGYVNAVKSKPGKRLSTVWRKGFAGILDAYLGDYPATFTVDGVSYTPKTYAASLPYKPENYIGLTSFTHHPFYQGFALEVPDNWLWEEYMNVPLEDLKAVVDYAVENGYPVAWGADVSEGGFNWKKGYAVMPKPTDASSLEGTELARWVKLSDKERKDKQFEIDGPCDEIEVTQESRQEMFDRQETTDDHGMEIVGYATDQKGNRYYKVKNSWDTNQVYGGYLYVSEPYFLAKTLDIYVNKEALPKDLRKKLNIK
ncbi:MAG: C1 family peptidase [Muribaculaceae bacterium]|nr:C1 family peptidase [Muribaculaceae bacterium]